MRVKDKWNDIVGTIVGYSYFDRGWGEKKHIVAIILWDKMRGNGTQSRYETIPLENLNDVSYVLNYEENSL